MSRRSKFSQEERRNYVLEAVTSSTPKEVAARIGVSQSTIYVWGKIFGINVKLERMKRASMMAGGIRV